MSEQQHILQCSLTNYIFPSIINLHQIVTKRPYCHALQQNTQQLKNKTKQNEIDPSLRRKKNEQQYNYETQQVPEACCQDQERQHWGDTEMKVNI